MKLKCRTPPFRGLVDMHDGRFVIRSTLATTQGFQQLIQHRLEILKQKNAASIYEHIDKTGVKAIKSAMKNDWLSLRATEKVQKDLYASVVLVVTGDPSPSMSEGTFS